MQRLARQSAAVLILAGGAVHLQLWRDGYRGIPRIGPWFLANVVISVVLAVALTLRNDHRVSLAAILFSVGSLGALVMSRTIGILGFTETAWTPPVARASGAEIGAILVLAAILATGGPHASARNPEANISPAQPPDEETTGVATADHPSR